jgi:hypothetical protein
MKNLNKRLGYKNRHLDDLPEDKAIVYVIINDAGEDEERIMLCQWFAYNREDYVGRLTPDVGYLGHMIVVEEEYNGIGFNAWEQTNSEFVYYQNI